VVEMFKIYRIQSKNYTIPIYTENFYIYIIEVPGSVDLALKEKVIRRPPYTDDVSIYETSFDKLTNGQRIKVIEAVFGSLRWK